MGLGMATATYPARSSPASAMARLLPDGTAYVQAGSQDIGTGTYTIMTQIAADSLGLPPERVRFELGDTMMPETPVSGRLDDRGQHRFGGPADLPRDQDGRDQDGGRGHGPRRSMA